MTQETLLQRVRRLQRESVQNSKKQKTLPAVPAALGDRSSRQQQTTESKLATSLVCAEQITAARTVEHSAVATCSQTINDGTASEISGPSPPKQKLHAASASGQPGQHAAASGARLRQFYGPPAQSATERKIQRFLQRVKHRLICSAPRQTFALQAQAFEFADAHALGHALSIFSVETLSRSRKFITATSEDFWRLYSCLPAGKRHYYEIIREACPCHLYFDLEFAPQHNPDADGNALVDHVVEAVTELLQRLFGICASADDFLELDSSTDAKFSRHLVLRLQDTAFHSNADAGAFVGQLLAEKGEQFLMRKDEAGTQTCFVDTSVYSRNRAFRLYLSSKAGKTAVLLPTGRLQQNKGTQRETFFRSLICNVPGGVQLLRCAAPTDGAVHRWQTVRRAAGGAARQQGGSSCGMPSQPPPSPYPDIDAFLASVCVQGGSQGYVRSWTAVDGSVVLFSMAGNRFCGNIGRQHKSNGIYYVVDLDAQQWWQKCFDPECGMYRSPALPLPLGLISRRQSSGNDEGVLADNDDTDLTELELLAAAEELEGDYLCMQAIQQWEQCQSTNQSQQRVVPCDGSESAVSTCSSVTTVG